MEYFIPKFETERLIIRPITIDDADDLFEIGSDDRVVRWLGYPRHESIKTSKELIEEWIKNPANNLPEYTVMELKENHKMIGACNFVRCRNDIAEIGYQLNFNYWNHGYMTEAVKALMKVGFEQLGIRRIEICHHVYNTNSEKVIKKCGFIYEGTFRKEIYDVIHQEYVDGKHYSLLKEEWEKQNEKRIGHKI